MPQVLVLIAYDFDSISKDQWIQIRSLLGLDVLLIDESLFLNNKKNYYKNCIFKIN
jgi:hypothetical protein